MLGGGPVPVSRRWVRVTTKRARPVSRGTRDRFVAMKADRIQQFPLIYDRCHDELSGSPTAPTSPGPRPGSWTPLRTRSRPCPADADGRPAPRSPPRRHGTIACLLPAVEGERRSLASLHGLRARTAVGRIEPDGPRVRHRAGRPRNRCRGGVPDPTSAGLLQQVVPSGTAGSARRVRPPRLPARVGCPARLGALRGTAGHP